MSGESKLGIFGIGIVIGIILGAFLLVEREHKKIEFLQMLNLAGK